MKEDTGVIVTEVELSLGDAVLEGHDCKIEDHHLTQQTTSFIFRMIIEGGGSINCAIPVDSEFAIAILDGTLTENANTLIEHLD